MIHVVYPAYPFIVGLTVQQLPETLLIDDILHSLYTTPLLPWLRDQDAPPDFDLRTPNCERGYIGCWKISDGVLWLIGLHAWRDGKFTKVADLFPGKRKVAAEWFSGPLVVEPAASEVSDGALPKLRTLLVEAGWVIQAEDAFAASEQSHPDA